jgi:thiamine biosynthesis lipoprotein
MLLFVKHHMKHNHPSPPALPLLAKEGRQKGAQRAFAGWFSPSQQIDFSWPSRLAQNLTWPITLLIFLTNPLQAQPKAYHKKMGLMGSVFELTAISDNDSLAYAALRAGTMEIQRIEELISSWDPRSQTSEINRQAGLNAVKVDWELFQLIRRAQSVSRLTDGAFDLSFASADRIWRFDGSMQKLPPDSLVAASVALIDHAQIELKPRDTTVFLRQAGMKIGFGGIGKGYAANRARERMQAMGIASGLVNAGGDLTCWGQPVDQKSWRIGLADPKSRDEMLAWLSLQDMAVVTSGDYERYAMIDGMRYAHIINPQTGWPCQGLKSVSIICPDAELADALATAVFVLGEKKGLDLVNQLKGIECVMVNDDDEIIRSEGIDLQFE